MLAPMDLAIFFGVAYVVYGPKGPGPGSGFGSGAAKRPPLLDERIVKWLDSWRRFHFIWIGSLIAASCYLGSVPPALSAESNSTALQEKVALSNEGATALKQKNYKLAVEKLEAVLKIDRDDNAARRNLATALNCVAMEETTSQAEAINCFHKSLF